MSAIDDLRSLSAGDRVRAETDEGEAFAFRVVDAPDYVEPDEYGAGHLVVSIEFEGDEDAPTTDAPHAGAGTVVARRESGDSLGRPKLTVETSDVEEHTGRRVERGDALGLIASVEVLEDGRGGASR